MKYLQGDWKTIAQGIPAGSNVRTRCSEGCGTDNSQIVSHDLRGYGVHCFRCGFHDYEPYGLRSISTLERHRIEREYLVQREVALPEDYTLDVPSWVAVWYFQYGISAELARAYGIGYSPSLHRIVLPVYSDTGKLVAVQMRAANSNVQPKYLNPEGPSVRGAVFRATAPIFSGVTVVVEDILSAIKIGRVAHACSILGTKMTDARANYIAARYHTAIVWLDSDKAGRVGAAKAMRKLEMQGMRVRQVVTPKDPKTYTLDVIRSTLEL